MIDTHSHIYGPEYSEDRDEVVNRALGAGVDKVILANVDSTSIQDLLDCNTKYPDFTEKAMGLHPTSVTDKYRSELRHIEDALRSGEYVAIGEIGLDLYWDKTYSEQQQIVMQEQIDWAISLGLPVILHIRKAYAEAFKVLNKFAGKPLRGVFHCFGGGVEEAKKAIDMGFYLGIGGVVTYKNSNLGEIIAPFGAEHIVLETDAPYLSPVPNRGKRNEPYNLVYIREKLSSVFQINSQKVDEITTLNAKELFRLQ